MVLIHISCKYNIHIKRTNIKVPSSIIFHLIYQVEVKPNKINGNNNSAAPASSFKPSANARLYGETGVNNTANDGTTAATATKNGQTSPENGGKKRSPTRTHSLPPRPSKPLVLKREVGRFFCMLLEMCYIIIFLKD